ncbi:MAG TPA: endolytic transglycosylase MltG [Gemmatimonadota bacterium]|nr:endolytic transglycosylase MltG [Gemmatimonadota bacterium]
MKRSQAVAGALLALTVGLVGWLWSASRAPDRGTATLVVVEQGTPVRALGRRLEEAGVIRSARLFEIWIRAGGNTRSIQAGTYEIPPGVSLYGVIDILVNGQTLLASVTIPEGLRLEQQAGVAARELGVDSAAFVAAATDSLLADSLGIEAPTLEGYLFPETYRVDPSTDARGLVRLMVGEFDRAFDDEWRERAEDLGRTVHEIVTLASIVEEEARVAEERPVIAGVFWNRLREGMKLEADPTVQYALGSHRQRVLYRDLEVDSPYNTYLYPGLPPGPIASPGRASLEATLYPDSVPWLYFFATGEGGRHTFSATFAEHNRKRRDLNR